MKLPGDPLNAARGILLGAAVGLLLWAAVAALTLADDDPPSTQWDAWAPPLSCERAAHFAAMAFANPAIQPTGEALRLADIAIAEYAPLATRIADSNGGDIEAYKLLVTFLKMRCTEA